MLLYVLEANHVAKVEEDTGGVMVQAVESNDGAKAPFSFVTIPYASLRL